MSILIPLAAVLIVPASWAQSNQPPTSSATNSKASAIRAVEPDQRKLVAACAAAADELVELRSLSAALERETSLLKERLDTEKRVSGTLSKLDETLLAEIAALRSALTAKDETIAAKNALIENRREMIEALKKRRVSPLNRLGDILIGAAVIAILK